MRNDNIIEIRDHSDLNFPSSPDGHHGDMEILKLLQKRRDYFLVFGYTEAFTFNCRFLVNFWLFLY